MLHNAVLTSAVTNHDDADITDLEAFRVSTNKENEKTGVKVMMLAFLIEAWVAALKKYPEFNSSLEGDCLVYKLTFTLDALNRPEQLKRPDSGHLHCPLQVLPMHRDTSWGITGSEKTSSFVGIFKMLTILKASALIEKHLRHIN